MIPVADPLAHIRLRMAALQAQVARDAEQANAEAARLGLPPIPLRIPAPARDAPPVLGRREEIPGIAVRPPAPVPIAAQRQGVPRPLRHRVELLRELLTEKLNHTQRRVEIRLSGDALIEAARNAQTSILQQVVLKIKSALGKFWNWISALYFYLKNGQAQPVEDHPQHQRFVSFSEQLTALGERCVRSAQSFDRIIQERRPGVRLEAVDLERMQQPLNALIQRINQAIAARAFPQDLIYTVDLFNPQIPRLDLFETMDQVLDEQGARLAEIRRQNDVGRISNAERQREILFISYA